MSKKYRYSEIFGRTFQGEGTYTGRQTVWLRVWGCNFNCSHFGLDVDDPNFDPTNVDIVPTLSELDFTQYKNVEDLPVFRIGCDSSYSWSQKFMHLAKQGTAEDIASEIRSQLINEFNPSGLFIHPKSKQPTHMAFTGGEPMMSQSCIVDVMSVFRIRDNDYPTMVTIETNGTQLPRQQFRDYFTNKGMFTGELFWSVSPKLYVSGEAWEDAIKPDVLVEYRKISNRGQLKYVCNGSQRCWDEIDRATAHYRKAGIGWDVWVMPVGARAEEQEIIQASVAEQAIDRGYSVAPRVHCWVFGNVVGK